MSLAAAIARRMLAAKEVAAAPSAKPAPAPRVRREVARSAPKASPPPSQRAKGAGTPRRERKRAAAPESAGSSGALERFRQVAAGLGLDPDAQLEAFAETWLAEVRSKVEDGA